MLFVSSSLLCRLKFCSIIILSFLHFVYINICQGTYYDVPIDYNIRELQFIFFLLLYLLRGTFLSYTNLPYPLLRFIISTKFPYSPYFITNTGLLLDSSNYCQYGTRTLMTIKVNISNGLSFEFLFKGTTNATYNVYVFTFVHSFEQKLVHSYRTQ